MRPSHRPEASHAVRDSTWFAWGFAAAVVFIVAYGGIELTRGTGRIAAIWGANAVLLVGLLRTDADRRAGVGFAGFLGNLAANVITGDTLLIGVSLPVINMVEVLICLEGLRRLGDHDLTRPRTLIGFCLIAVGPASLASSLLAASLFAATNKADFETLFTTWYAADALGLITFTPLFASVAQLRPDGFPRGRRLAELVLSVGCFAAVLAAIFLQTRYPLLFLVYPALVVVAFQFGLTGASISLVATAMVALVATSHGMGPLSLVSGSLREKITVLQVFVAVSAFMSLQVAAVLAERNRLIEQLRAAKDAAEQAEDRSRDSERRYRLLAEHTGDVIVLRGLDGRAEYVSPSITTMLGFDPKDFVALTRTDLLHPDEVAAVMRLRDILGPERPKATIVHRLRHRDGGWVWADTAFTFVQNADSGQPRILAVVRDVTERQAQAAQIDAARQAAEDALAVKSEFVAMMSHELRTPLNAIIGFSNLLLESGELASAEGRRFARNIQTASEALLAIVNDVMDVSKIEAGAIELDPQPFSLPELFDGVGDIVRGQAEAKGLKLKIDVDPRIPGSLIGDDGRLRQILLNLLSNAVKFTAAGEVALRAIWEHGDQTYARMRITVSDSGIGIPAEKRDRLFKRFSQVDQSTSRRFGGTGLGLSICKSLLDLMGSTIVVRSQENVGSEFDFDLRLPVAREQPQTSAVPASASSSSAAGPDLHVLVAEDVLLNQELLAALLAKWGHVADIVSDGAAAVDAVQRRTYDLVLMDVQMPGLDGIEATQRIRALDGPGRSVPIIALTANVAPDDVARFRAAGMDDHVGKPFVPDELRAAIDRRARPDPAPGPGPGPLAAREAAKLAAPFEPATLEELRRLVGSDTVASFLARLREQMAASFTAAPRDLNQLAALRHEAHALASTAGMLGFRQAANACIALETACDARHASVGAAMPALGAALNARNEAMVLLDALMESAAQ